MGRYSGTLERDDSALRRALRVTVSRQTESADRHCSWIKRRFYHPMVLGQLPNAQKPTCRLPRRAQKLRSPDNTPAGSGTPSGSALPWHGLATTRSRSPVIARRGRLWRSECRSLTCSQVCDHNVPHAPLITPRATFIDDTRMGSDFCTTHEKQARQACTKARGPCTRALNSTLGALFGSPWVKTPPKCGCLAGGGQVAHDAASMTAREETQHALLGIMRTPPSKAQCGRGPLTRYL